MQVMDKGFIKERDMVHQVLRERSIMSSIVTSNARYLSTLISCIDLSLLSYIIHSPFLYTILLIPLCQQSPASIFMILILHSRPFVDTCSPHCTSLYINILIFFSMIFTLLGSVKCSCVCSARSSQDRAST